MNIVSDGVRLNVIDTRDGDLAIVFVHHWGGSSQTWSGVISGLRNRFRCIAIDARGAGGSEAPDYGYSTEDHASDVQSVIASLALTRYVVVGHSMGGKACQVFAARRTQGLSGLALIASSPPSPMAIDDAQRDQMRMAYADREAVEWSLNNVLLGSSVPDLIRARLIADALRLSSRATVGWIDTGTREDFSATVTAINVPIVVVAGELDRVDPVSVVKAHILPHYPSALVEFLPGKGHLLPVEAPDETARIIEQFCDSLRAVR